MRGQAVNGVSCNFSPLDVVVYRQRGPPYQITIY